MISPALRRVTLAGTWVLLAVVAGGCTTHGHEASVQAALVGEGATEAVLLRAAGRPTRRQEPPFPDCAKAGGTHNLIYETTIRDFGGWLGEHLSSLVSVCIGPTSRIIETRHVEF